MTSRRYIALVPAILLVLAVIAVGTLLHRTDLARQEARAARDDARNAYGHAAAVRDEMTAVLQAQRVYNVELSSVRGQLNLCRRRTDYLRDLTYTTFSDSLPKPMPGWPEWKTP